MEDTIKIRKDKVKNIAIVFLSIMLVLTFFSNSILNRALPEVATAYVEYNTITEKVRGTGTVTALDPYKVVIKDTRTIESVAVMVGDEVTKDQVLFYLADKESDELEALEKELDDLILNYSTAILSGDISSTAFQNIQSDNIASITEYQTQIEAAKQKVEDAQDKVDDIERQILLASTESGEQTDRTTDLAIAEANKSEASARVETAKTKVSAIQAQVDSLEDKMVEVLGDDVIVEEDIDGDGDLEKKIEVGIAKINTALNDAINGDGGTEKSKTAYESAKTALVDKLKEDYPTVNEEGAPITAPGLTDDQIKKYFDSKGFPNMDKIDELEKKAKEHDGDTANDSDSASSKFQKMKSAYMTYLDAVDRKDELQAIYDAYFKLPGQLKSAKDDLDDAEDDYEDYEDEIEDLSEESIEYTGDMTEWQNALKISLEDANTALETAKEEQTQLLLDISKELDLSNQNSIIAEKKAELEELREKSTGTTIVAPVDGTIISLDITAGEDTVPEEAVATIQQAGKGMTVSFSVTNAQAAKVKVGDKAELQNAWYYEDVMVTLTKIKPDPDDPGKKKLLEFNVEGSVSNGESLSLSVGERSAEYEHVVPNSAVREDNNGKFILIIEEKSTPFGNRYKAKRVDVEVLASDEMNTAIMAELQGYEYVITTSNQPVEAGDQVRLNG